MTTALSPASTRSIMTTWTKEESREMSNGIRCSRLLPAVFVTGLARGFQPPVRVTSAPNSQSKRRINSRGASAEAVRGQDSRHRAGRAGGDRAARSAPPRAGPGRCAADGPPRRRRAPAPDPRRGRGCGQHPGVLQRHRRALRQERQHRVAGVAEQRQPAVRPARQRRVVEEPPQPALLDRRQQRTGRPSPSREGAAQVLRVVGRRPAFGRPRRRAPRPQRSSPAGRRAADRSPGACPAPW